MAVSWNMLNLKDGVIKPRVAVVGVHKCHSHSLLSSPEALCAYTYQLCTIAYSLWSITYLFTCLP